MQTNVRKHSNKVCTDKSKNEEKVSTYSKKIISYRKSVTSAPRKDQISKL